MIRGFAPVLYRVISEDTNSPSATSVMPAWPLASDAPGDLGLGRHDSEQVHYEVGVVPALTSGAQIVVPSCRTTNFPLLMPISK